MLDICNIWVYNGYTVNQQETETKMNQTEKRQTAIGATRSQMRTMGINPKSENSQEALTVLDDIARSEPNLIASEWYIEASDNQIKLFRQDWNQYLKGGY